MKTEIIAIADADPGIDASKSPACELLGMALHDGLQLELIGAGFSVQAVLNPASAAVLAARLADQVAAHLLNEGAQ